MTALDAVIGTSPPYADLYISDLPAGTAQVHITRVFHGVSVRVRGDSTTPVLGTSTHIVDWALPVSATGEHVTYIAQAVAASGAALGDPAVVEVATAEVDHSQAWLSDPYDPTDAVLVTLLAVDGEESAESATSLVRTMTGMPVGIDAGRDLRATAWGVEALDEDTVRRVDAVIGSGTSHEPGTGILLLRGDAACLDHPTGVIHLSAPRVERERLLPHRPHVHWTFSATETRGPRGPVAVERRTYADDLAQHPTYADSLAALPTYLDRLRAEVL